MAKLRSSKLPRGGTHSTYTATGRQVAHALHGLRDIIKSISPRKINPLGGSSRKKIVCVETNVGIELLISGEGFMKVVIHTDHPEEFTRRLKDVKKLRDFLITDRKRNPGER